MICHLHAVDVYVRFRFDKSSIKIYLFEIGLDLPLILTLSPIGIEYSSKPSKGH